MITFFNIKTGERKALTRPHQIGAYLNSSDLSVNANFGQDFGWRLAPEVIIKIDEFRADPRILEDIARRIGVDISELTVIHLVQHISYLDDMGQKIEAQREELVPKYQSEYEADIARRREELNREWNDVVEDEEPEAPVVEEEAKPTEPVQTDLEEEVAKKAAEAPATPKKK